MHTLTWLIVLAAPIIAVFTKYDLLISRMQREMGESDDIKNEADVIVKQKCIEPLEKEAGQKVPNVTVSSECRLDQITVLYI